MTTPLLTHEKDLDARAFSLMNLSTKTDDQRLDV